MYIYIEHGQRFSFVMYFNIMHFANIIIFRIEKIYAGSLLLSGVALLNWFTKSSKFGVGFNNNELFWSLFSPFHCILQFSRVGDFYHLIMS